MVAWLGKKRIGSLKSLVSVCKTYDLQDISNFLTFGHKFLWCNVANLSLFFMDVNHVAFLNFFNSVINSGVCM
jgi:hypothetical protein